MKTLLRIAKALEDIRDILRDGVVRVKDIDRAKVYSEHLGEKLRPCQHLGTLRGETCKKCGVLVQ